VLATLVEDAKKREGKRFARLKDTDLVGPIINRDDVPAEKLVGDELTLVVASASRTGNITSIQFRYPTAADDRHQGGRRVGR
jgi:hypothetical protein